MMLKRCAPDKKCHFFKILLEGLPQALPVATMSISFEGLKEITLKNIEVVLKKV